MYESKYQRLECLKDSAVLRGQLGMHGKSAWLRLSPLLCFPLLYSHYVNGFLLVKMEEDHCSTITELGKNTGVFICCKGQNKTQPRISRFCLPGIHLFIYFFLVK